MRSLAWVVAFLLIVSAWGTRELVTADVPRLPPSETSPSTMQLTPALPTRSPTPAPPGPGRSPSPESPEPASEPARVPPASSAEPRAQASPPAAATPAPGPLEEELRLQRLLDQDATAFSAALLSGDEATVRALMAARCAGREPVTFIAARRTAIQEETGVAIDQLRPGNPLTVHFDITAGEAHAFLGLFADRGRALTATPDGWLLEDGHWRNAQC